MEISIPIYLDRRVKPRPLVGDLRYAAGTHHCPFCRKQISPMLTECGAHRDPFEDDRRQITRDEYFKDFKRGGFNWLDHDDDDQRPGAGLDQPDGE